MMQAIHDFDVLVELHIRARVEQGQRGHHKDYDAIHYVERNVFLHFGIPYLDDLWAKWCTVRRLYLI